MILEQRAGRIYPKKVGPRAAVKALVVKQLTRAFLALGLAMCMTLAITPGQVRGSVDDDAAIAQFLSIGFANADTDFASLRGALVGRAGIYLAANWPDQTHFRTCSVYYHSTIMARIGIPEVSAYTCASTFRDEPEPELFKMAASAVRASLPPGYKLTDSGKGGLVGIEFEGWSKPHEPTVQVTTDTEEGMLFYQLEIRKP